jgi:hypothetical protein
MEFMADLAQDNSNAGLPLNEDAPYRGKSPLLMHLPYLDIRSVAIIPFMHAFFQGLVKDFLKAILAKAQRPPGMAGSGRGRAGKRQVAGSGSSSSRKAKRNAASAAGRSQSQPAAAAAAAAAAAGAPAQQQQSARGRPLQTAQEREQQREHPGFGMQPPQEDDTAVLPKDKKVPPAFKRLLTSRAGGYANNAHPDRNRLVRDPVKYIAGYHFDELVGALMLFAPLFWPVCTESGQVLAQVIL